MTMQWSVYQNEGGHLSLILNIDGKRKILFDDFEFCRKGCLKQITSEPWTLMACEPVEIDGVIMDTKYCDHPQFMEDFLDKIAYHDELIAVNEQLFVERMGQTALTAYGIECE